MRIQLFSRPRRLELLDEVRRTDHFATLRANQLDGACIDQRDVWYRILRRILHGYFFRAADQHLQIFFQFLGGGVEHFVSGQRVESCGFNPVHEFSRRALRRNHVEPAALRHGMVESQDAVGNRIAVKNVVEEPSVNLLLAESDLDGFDVWHRGTDREIVASRSAFLSPQARESLLLSLRKFRRAWCGCVPPQQF